MSRVLAIEGSVMAAENESPVYQASVRYVGKMGEDYFTYQSAVGDNDGQVTADILQPYVNAGDTVLDFGAGTGNLLHCLKANRKVAVEFNQSARQGCKDRFGEEIEIHSDLSTLESASIDVCVSNHCLEHVPYPGAALREIHRVLRPGGRLALRVPIDDWRCAKQYDPEDINHHLHTWTPLNLGNTLSDAGFERFVLKIDYVATPPRHVDKFYRALPKPMFYAMCRLLAILLKRRSIVAVCER